MKKHLIAVALLGLASVGLSACGGGNSGDDGSFAAIVEAGEKMTEAELIEKAKAESGKFIAYGNTSRITTAMENFVTKYGSQLGLDGNSATASKMSDSNIYTALTNEADSNDKSQAASMVLVQDSATLSMYRANSSLLANYVSDTFKANVDSDDLVPLAHQFINKMFIWNNTAGEAAPSFSNVWELLDTKYQGKIYFKSPTDEAVNKNFLMTLTSDAWATKMAAAYKEYYKTDFVATSELKNASYAWIKGFLANADTASYTSDTKMAAGVSKEENSDKIGLFVLSKFRDSSVTSENLTVGAWDHTITPFAGFMYSIYAQLVTAGPRPYTAMLFTNYLMTAEGFAPWGGSVGGYSANNSIPQYEGDKPLSFYKQNLVIENGTYINTVKTELSPWIDSLLAKA